MTRYYYSWLPGWWPAPSRIACRLCLGAGGLPRGPPGKPAADRVQARQARAGLCHRDSTQSSPPEAGGHAAAGLGPLHTEVCPFSREGTQQAHAPAGWEPRPRREVAHRGRGPRKGGSPSLSAAWGKLGESVALGIRQAWVGVPALPVTSCMALDNLTLPCW